jgi:hypothetical protein
MLGSGSNDMLIRPSYRSSFINKHERGLCTFKLQVASCSLCSAVKMAGVIMHLKGSDVS